MTKYYINDCEVLENDFCESLEEDINIYVEENIDEIIDECYEEVEIGCCTFYPSEILKNCDPIAYNCYISDEENAEYENFKYELENGDEIEVNDTFYRIEEEEDEE